MDTGLYRDIVYTEYMLEHDLTWTQMQERVHVDENVEACGTHGVAGHTACSMDGRRGTTVHCTRGLSFLMCGSV